MAERKQPRTLRVPAIPKKKKKKNGDRRFEAHRRHFFCNLESLRDLSVLFNQEITSSWEILSSSLHSSASNYPKLQKRGGWHDVKIGSCHLSMGKTLKIHIRYVMTLDKFVKCPPHFTFLKCSLDGVESHLYLMIQHLFGPDPRAISDIFSWTKIMTVLSTQSCPKFG